MRVAGPPPLRTGLRSRTRRPARRGHRSCRRRDRRRGAAVPAPAHRERDPRTAPRAGGRPAGARRTGVARRHVDRAAARGLGDRPSHRGRGDREHHVRRGDPAAQCRRVRRLATAPRCPGAGGARMIGARGAYRLLATAAHRAETPLAAAWRWTTRITARDETAAVAARGCLVIAPHPDDETLGCGATIARKRAAGTPVRVVIVADGRYAQRAS